LVDHFSDQLTSSANSLVAVVIGWIAILMIYREVEFLSLAWILLTICSILTVFIGTYIFARIYLFDTLVWDTFNKMGIDVKEIHREILLKKSLLLTIALKVSNPYKTVSGSRAKYLYTYQAITVYGVIFAIITWLIVAVPILR